MIKLILAIQLVFFTTLAPVSVYIWQREAAKHYRMGEANAFVKYTTIGELMEMEVRI